MYEMFSSKWIVRHRNKIRNIKFEYYRNEFHKKHVDQWKNINDLALKPFYQKKTKIQLFNAKLMYTERIYLISDRYKKRKKTRTPTTATFCYKMCFWWMNRHVVFILFCSNKQFTYSDINSLSCYRNDPTCVNNMFLMLGNNTQEISTPY